MPWLPEGSHGLPEPDEMHNTAAVSFADDKLAADVQLKCPWESRYGVLEAMLLAPVEWPYLVGSHIYAVSGRVDPFPGEPSGTVEGEPSLIAYENALLSVHFETLSITGGGEGGGSIEIFSESLEPTAEFLTIPNDGFRWGSGTGDQVKAEEAPGKLVVGFDWVLVFFKVPTIPAHVLLLPGHVNSGTCISPTLGLTFAPETLLYNPPKVNRTVSIGGDNRYTLQLRLTWRADGWNKYWRSEKTPNPGFDQMFPEGTDTDPYKNYPLADFSSVLPTMEGS